MKSTKSLILKILFISAMIFYITFDLISTIAAANYLGTFQYEKSTLLKASFDLGGMAGFIIIKIILSTISLALAYTLGIHFKKFYGVAVGLLCGATLAGLFVGMSNFNIILNGSSYWIFGIDSGTIAAILIIGCSMLGFLFVPGDI